VQHWNSPKPPKPDPDSPNDLHRHSSITSGLTSALQQHQQQHSSSLQLQTGGTGGVPGITITGSSSNYQLGAITGGITAPIDSQYRSLCGQYNAPGGPAAAHQVPMPSAAVPAPAGPPSLGYGSAFAGHGSSGVASGQGSLGSATHHNSAAGSYCMPMGQY